MNTNSNIYTFIYASVLVVVVAALLSFTAIKLQPIQEQNIRIEKMQNILSSVGIESSVEQAEEMFNKFITKDIVINTKADKVEGQKAFDLNLKKEYKKSEETRFLPAFEATLDDGSKKIIIPLLGKGLWGPVWGYVSFNEDFNTIYGATFDHKSETPGLGADINKSWFEDQFKGKTIFDGEKLTSITIHKGGKGAAAIANNTEHGVDAISGGTITCKGVEEMIKDCLLNYEPYLNNNRSK